MAKLNSVESKRSQSTQQSFGLDTASVGQPMTLLAFSDPLIAKKLLSMGILPGSEVRLIKKLWNGSNFFLACNQQRIALRKDEAASIQVKWRA